LTIIAQSSSVVQSQAIELLDQFEQSLRAILKEDGRNIVSKHNATVNGVDRKVGTLTEPSITEAASGIDSDGRVQCGSFRWTKEALQIRHEIATLADVDESQVKEISSIFELGLDSIDVIKLSSRLSKRSIAIPVSAIIKSQTIAIMSTKISRNGTRKQQAGTGKTVQEIGRDLIEYLKDNQRLPDDAEVVLPATPLQQSMVNEMIKSEYKRYFTVEAFEIDEKIDASRLLLAVDEVIRVSPILRTTFTEIDDPRSPVSYAQIVHSGLIGSTEISKKESLEATLEQFKTKSAALAASKQALCQIKCVSVEHSRYLIMGISHALYDGRSLRAIHEDIQRAYHGKLSPRPDSSPYLELVFPSTTDDAKRFWRSALSNLPAATFPRKETSAVADPNQVHRKETPSHVSLADVEAFCRSSRITMQTLGQTCWAIVLSRLMGQLDVVFGSVLSCRDSEEADAVMFPLMNTVAVRSVLHGSIGEMLKYMQEMSDTTRQYQHFPLGAAQAYALASRESGSSTNDTTLFDTLFIYQGRRQPQESDSLYTSVYGSSDVEFPVCVEMEIEDEHLSWTIACKSIARTATETKEIVAGLDSVLQRIITFPKAPIIISDSDGISVCGLPKFRKPEPSQRNVTNHSPKWRDENWSEVELKIQKVLHEVSDVPLDAIRKDSTIFHLGLDSILVLKLPALLRRCDIKLSVSSILRDQTVYAMAQSVLRSGSDKQESLDVEKTLSDAMSSFEASSVVKSLEVEVGEVQSVMPVTAGQQCMIRTWQASRGTLFYPSFEYILSGSVNKTQLGKAWKSLLQSHDILRTGFVEIYGVLIQAVFKDPLNEVVYSTTEARSAQKTLTDLRFPPVTLVVKESKPWVIKLKLEIHHALYDGISLPLLIDQLKSLYRGETLPAPELSFRTFVAKSIAASKRPQLHLSTPAAKTLSQSKWMSYIKHESLYPTHTINGTSTVSSDMRTDVFHPGMKVSPVKRVAQDSGVSIDALLLAAISKIYAQRLGQDNATMVSQVVFGIYLANRAPFGEDLSQLAAPTLNLLPLCVRDPLNLNLPDIAKDIQRDLQEISSVEMSCASLAEIYNWCGSRVNFFVNILKNTATEAAIANSSHVNGVEDGENSIFEPKQDTSKRAEVVHVKYNENIARDSRHEAYLVRLLEGFNCLKFKLLTVCSLPWMLRSAIRGLVWIWGCLGRRIWSRSLKPKR
jgi:aryl carrier-like protein